MIQTSGYLIIQPTRRGHDGKVVGVELDRLVKTKPTRLGVRDIAIRIVLRVDERLFTVPEPEVTIELDDRRALVVPTIEVPLEEPKGARVADDILADGPSDREYLERLGILAHTEGNPVARAIIEGRRPWPPGGANPRFEASLRKGLEIVARAGPVAARKAAKASLDAK